MTDALFITGTGTGIGKTFFTAALTRALIRAGKRVQAIKPVVSGYADDCASDPARLLSAMNIPHTAEAIGAIAPWRYRAPLSPHLAARMEGNPPTLQEVVSFCRGHAHARPDALLVEGAGGIMSPLNEHHVFLDLAAALGHEAVLLCGGYPGSISHALTAIAALGSRGLALRAVVVNAAAGGHKEAAAAADAIRQFAPGPLSVYNLPHAEHADSIDESEAPWLNRLPLP